MTTIDDLVGQSVTAKRFGWDEELTPEQELDMEPYSEQEYESDDLSGVLEIIKAGDLTVYLVGGQEADPKTIRPAPSDRSPEKSFKGSGWEDQPRVPAGSPEGGQFAPAEGGGSSGADRASRRQANRRAALARRGEALSNALSDRIAAAGHDAARLGLDAVAAVHVTAAVGVAEADTPREIAAAIQDGLRQHRRAVARVRNAVGAVADQYTQSLIDLTPRVRREIARSIRSGLRLDDVLGRHTSGSAFEDARRLATTRGEAIAVLREAVERSLDADGLVAAVREWTTEHSDPADLFQSAFQADRRWRPGRNEPAESYRDRLAALGAAGLPDPAPGESAEDYELRDAVGDAIHDTQVRIGREWLTGFADHLAARA